MTDKFYGKALLLSFAFCLSAPAIGTPPAAFAADGEKTAAATPAPAADAPPAPAPTKSEPAAAPAKSEPAPAKVEPTPAKAELPPAKVEPPAAKPEPPAARPEPPAAKAEPPAAKAEPPAAKAEPPAAKVHGAAAKTESPAENADEGASKAGHRVRHVAKGDETIDQKHKDSMSDIQRRHMDEGYYGGANLRGSDNQQRHTDEGYYSEVKPYAPPPLEAKPVASPLTQPIQVGPPPLIVPAVGAGGHDKFDDDIGGTGSITATRHAKQAKDLLQSGHFDLAKSHFRESLAHAPEQLDLYPGYWETCAKTNDWGEARRALEKFFEMDANKRKEYLWAYGETWYQLKNFDKAVPILKEASKYGVHEEDIHKDLLKIALNQHNAIDIPVEYAAVIKINPSDVKSHLDFANWLEVQGRHTDAIGQYRTAANLTPGDGSLAARLAYMLMYYNHDYRTAISYYRKAMSADPANAAKYQENIKYAESQVAQPSPSSAPVKKREQQ